MTDGLPELVATLDEWAAAKLSIASATVVATSGSTPRSSGARLVVREDCRLAGSVSGGCLEGAVVEESLEVLRHHLAPRVVHYQITDEMGWGVGLACGGNVDIFIEAFDWAGADHALMALRTHLVDGRAVALVTDIEGERAGRHTLLAAARAVKEELPADLRASHRVLEDHLRSGEPGVEAVSGGRVYVEPFLPAAQLVIVGAVHVAQPLADMALATGYRVTVIDPRRAFLTRERFSDRVHLIPGWPQHVMDSLELGSRDAVVCLAHDPKFEDPALIHALGGGAGYVGAIGSRSTHEARISRLRAAGVAAAACARLHSPVGLDIGASGPSEIAVAILAEVIAVRRGASGGKLRDIRRTAELAV